MSISYKPNYCENCKRVSGGLPTWFQVFLFIILLMLFIIPGVIYYFCAKPSRCFICGLKKRHKTNKNINNK